MFLPSGSEDFLSISVCKIRKNKKIIKENPLHVQWDFSGAIAKESAFHL
jgi:hypothetical protein